MADTTDESKVETQPVSNDSNTNESQGVETQLIVEATNTNESETNNSVQTQENPEVDVVAKIGDTAYASLDDALSAAQDNDTINLSIYIKTLQPKMVLESMAKPLLFKVMDMR